MVDRMRLQSKFSIDSRWHLLVQRKETSLLVLILQYSERLAAFHLELLQAILFSAVSSCVSGDLLYVLQSRSSYGLFSGSCIFQDVYYKLLMPNCLKRPYVLKYTVRTRCNFGAIVYQSLQCYSTCFGSSLRPSSGALKTVVAATGACHWSG